LPPAKRGYSLPAGFIAEHQGALRLIRDSFAPADPVAIHESFNGVTTLSGEEKLMLAVLRDAIECFQQLHYQNTARIRNALNRAKLDSDEEY
jgi:hypothetical protein